MEQYYSNYRRSGVEVTHRLPDLPEGYRWSFGLSPSTLKEMMRGTLHPLRDGVDTLRFVFRVGRLLLLKDCPEDDEGCPAVPDDVGCLAEEWPEGTVGSANPPDVFAIARVMMCAPREDEWSGVARFETTLAVHRFMMVQSRRNPRFMANPNEFVGSHRHPAIPLWIGI
jgi:hypothetical protein